MRIQLGQLRSQADLFYKQANYLAAARLYVSVLRRNPEDFEARMGLADTLAAIGATTEAALVYEATARLCINGGRPLVAIVAAREMERHGRRCGELMARLSVLYSQGSKRLAQRGGRLNPRGADAIAVDAKEFRRQRTVSELVGEAVRVGSELDGVSELPLRFFPTPVLSQLSPVRMVELIRGLVVHRVPAGGVVFRRGDPGASCFLVAKGKVRVLRHVNDRTEELAVLSDGAVVGEMSLVSGKPRSATVQAVEETDLLEIGPKALAAAGDELPRIVPELHKLARKRWMSNVIDHHPIFQTFCATDRRELLRHFQALKVPQGALLFSQGDVVGGIFLVVSGEVGLTYRHASGSAPQLVDRAGPGSAPGIDSLISESPSPVSATALVPSTVLFLSRSTYRELAAALPEVVEALRPRHDAPIREISRAC